MSHSFTSAMISGPSLGRKTESCVGVFSCVCDAVCKNEFITSLENDQRGFVYLFYSLFFVSFSIKESQQLLQTVDPLRMISANVATQFLLMSLNSSLGEKQIEKHGNDDHVNFYFNCCFFLPIII